MPIKVVFDTNILLSGIGWNGKPYTCIELARNGVVEGVTCRELLDELSEKLDTKLEFSAEQIIDTIADLMSFLSLVRINGDLKVITNDPADDKVLECAIVSGATHIITGDRRHLLPLKEYRGIRIFSASELLTLLEKS
jgi:putative PIN family toxin of toxin-antitoxin system